MKKNKWQRLLQWLCEAEIIAHDTKLVPTSENTSNAVCERCGKIARGYTTLSMHFEWDERDIPDNNKTT